MSLALAPQFQPIQDWNDEFLMLWSHRYDYLWAEHPNPGERPDWQTESRHPLNDRLIQQGGYLYGVRFGSMTNYCLLDVDRDSLYHPARDRFAWRRMVAALESLGLVQPVICTSSHSGGLHLYFPFEGEQKTWAIALAVAALLENAGFKLIPGQLEVFPNRKPFSPSGEVTLYNGHRLPMQMGSYLLNAELHPLWGDQQTFVQQWRFAQGRNGVETRVLERILKASRRRAFRITGKAEKFLNDLNAEIEQGWTGRGQTNRLLGRIAMRSYIFGHVLYSETPLEGKDLVRDIVKIAVSLPGYQEWCQHQHEIEERATHWMMAIERSHYFHYGMDKKPGIAQVETKDETSKWNQQQGSDAHQRIQSAVASLLEEEALPSGITERFDALVSYGISGSTLYRYRELWHPRYFEMGEFGERQEGAGQECRRAAPDLGSLTNLLEENGCNSLLDKVSSDLEIAEELEVGCNFVPVGELRSSQPKEMEMEEGVAHIKQVLSQIRARRLLEQAQEKSGD
jgi:hypothetical protein